MNRYLFVLLAGLLFQVFSCLAQSQDIVKPGYHHTFFMFGYPCDSLYKIKGLKNVTCDNYAVVRFSDVTPFIGYANQKLHWSNIRKEGQEIKKEEHEEMHK